MTIMATLYEQLDAMLGMEPNWDGYGADPVRPETAAVVKEFVRLLSILWSAERESHEMFVAPAGTAGLQSSGQTLDSSTNWMSVPTGALKCYRKKKAPDG